MGRPNECKWCGCGDIERETPVMQSLIVTFACGTMSDTDAGGTRWLRDQRCAGPVGRLYKRIKRAVEVLEAANQIMMTLDDDEDVSFVVESQTVSHAIEILEGEEDDETD